MKACFPCTVAFYQEVCRIFFFLRKVFEELETGNPEVPLYFGEGLRRSLGNAAGCAGGRQMGCAGLSFAWMFLCVETQLGAIS